MSRQWASWFLRPRFLDKLLAATFGGMQRHWSWPRRFWWNNMVFGLVLCLIRFFFEKVASNAPLRQNFARLWPKTNIFRVVILGKKDTRGEQITFQFRLFPRKAKAERGLWRITQPCASCYWWMIVLMQGLGLSAITPLWRAWRSLEGRKCDVSLLIVEVACRSSETSLGREGTVSFGLSLLRALWLPSSWLS